MIARYGFSDPHIRGTHNFDLPKEWSFHEEISDCHSIKE